jgi:hypothetical protein
VGTPQVLTRAGSLSKVWKRFHSASARWPLLARLL